MSLSFHCFTVSGRIYRVSPNSKIFQFFSGGVAMFDLAFLGRFFTKIGSFCAHWKGNFLLLFLVHFYGHLNKDSPFFGTPLYTQRHNHTFHQSLKVSRIQLMFQIIFKLSIQLSIQRHVMGIKRTVSANRKNKFFRTSHRVASIKWFEFN